jgi:cupin 2 domain-containing protein
MISENIFRGIPEALDDELVEQLVEGRNIRIERIVSRGQSSPESGWYDQVGDEWVMLLRGGAVLLFDDQERVSLSPGDYINIPAHRKHKVEWTDPDRETVWLAVHY